MPGGKSATPPAVTTDRAMGTAGRTSSASGSGEGLSATVLVIEDDPIVREGLEMVLQDWGLSVTAVGCLPEAEAALRDRAGPLDLIIVDYHLTDGPSGLDGLDRLSDWIDPMPASLVVTGSTDGDVLRRIEASGVPRLHKPVAPQSLRRALNRLLTPPADL